MFGSIRSFGPGNVHEAGHATRVGANMGYQIGKEAGGCKGREEEL